MVTPATTNGPRGHGTAYGWGWWWRDTFLKANPFGARSRVAFLCVGASREVNVKEEPLTLLAWLWKRCTYIEGFCSAWFPHVFVEISPGDDIASTIQTVIGALFAISFIGFTSLDGKH